MTKFLDLDAVAPSVDFTLKLNGKEHPLKVASVDTFIKNMRELEALPVNASPIEEMEMTIKIILRAFPTLTEKEVRGLNLDQVRAISQFAREANGEIAEEEKETPEGNADAAS